MSSARHLASQVNRVLPNTIALLGDSQCANATLDASGNPWNGSTQGQSLPGQWRYYPSSSWWAPLQIMLKHRLKLVGNFGIGGQTSDQIAARVSSITGLNPMPGYAVLQGGINDIKGGVTAATIKTNLLPALRTLSNAGIVTIFPNLSPCDQVVSGTTAFTELMKFNAWHRDYCRTNPNIIGVDWHDPIADPTSGITANGFVSTNSMTVDGLHYSQLGGGQVAYALFNALDPIIPRQSASYINPRDPLNLLTASGNTIALTSGTGGSLTGTATGQLATGWALNASTGTVTLSKVSRPQTSYQWQQVVLATGTVAFRTGTVTTGFVAGTDSVTGTLEFETGNDWSGITAFNLAVTFVGGTPATSGDHFRFNGQDASNVFPFPGAGRLKTPDILIPVGTTGLQLTVTFNGGSGTLRFSDAEIRKST